MTREERDELRRLSDAATPGPWTLERVVDSNGVPYSTLCEVWAFVDPNVCSLWANRGTNLSDANFIAAARDAIPRLLDVIDEAHAAFTREHQRGEAEHLVRTIEDEGITQSLCAALGLLDAPDGSPRSVVDLAAAEITRLRLRVTELELENAFLAARPDYDSVPPRIVGTVNMRLSDA